MKQISAMIICLLLMVAGCRSGGGGAGDADDSIPSAGDEDYTASSYAPVFKMWEELQKPFTDADKTGQDDSNMCWSASAANILAWTDWAAHANDADNVISDVIGLDQAVVVAKQFGVIDNDMLIIVTADHETGGMSVDLTSSGLPDEDGPFFMPDGTPFYVNWLTSGHTDRNVPTSAQGQYSEMLNGVHDNTYIYFVMVQ